MSDPLPASASNLMYSVQPTDIGSRYAVGIELEVSDMLSTDKARFRAIEQP
jgi:hypothetical protein